MEFKLWSESNSEAKNILQPDLGLRPFAKLTRDERTIIWSYLEKYFFTHYSSSLYEWNYANEVNQWELKDRQTRIEYSIYSINQKYKAKNYGASFLRFPSLRSACEDFYQIFINMNEHVVLELITIYCTSLISEKTIFALNEKTDETDEEYEEYTKKYYNEIHTKFDTFAFDLNELFIQFSVNLELTRLGFIPRQEEKIIEDIYKPVIRSLSHPKWERVNVLLSDAFNEYRTNSPDSYSTCITHCAASLEAFLQIALDLEIGKETFSKLIPVAQKGGIIPDDIFTTTIFKNIESIFARERKITGDAHPKKEYASEKNARMMLNLLMVFLQHCIQNP